MILHDKTELLVDQVHKQIFYSDRDGKIENLAIMDAVDKNKYPADHPIIKRMVYMKKMVNLFSDGKQEKKAHKQSSSVSKQTELQQRPRQAKYSLIVKGPDSDLPHRSSLPQINSTKAGERVSLNPSLSATLQTP